MGKNGAYGGRGLIVFRDAGGRLKAFDSKCTHAGCNVGFQGDRIFCNCHGGVYDLNGKNIAGPPPRPLTELGVVAEGELLYVFRKNGTGQSES
ncbi:MAG: Rieske (2Fe-2S) protein [Planctomycetes bacterium]|nr:Rieske (2Fe-2S) protein [Planctomycetota bacterium]